MNWKPKRVFRSGTAHFKGRAKVYKSQVGASGLANDVYNAVAEVPTGEETYDLFSVRANFQIVK